MRLIVSDCSHVERKQIGQASQGEFVHEKTRWPAGTAVGIATAFGAPIGGLLFAMEELATNGFSQALGWQTFFACMVGVFTVDTFRSAQSAVAQGRFGLFEGEAGTVLFEVRVATVYKAERSGDCLMIRSPCSLI